MVRMMVGDSNGIQQKHVSRIGPSPRLALLAQPRSQFWTFLFQLPDIQMYARILKHSCLSNPLP